MSDLKNNKLIISSVKASYKWEIDNFRKIKLPVGKSFESPIFNLNCTCKKGSPQWCLVIYPKGSTPEDDTYVSLFLQLKNETTVKARYYFSIQNTCYEKTCETNLGPSIFSFKENPAWGISRLINRSILFDPNYKLLHNEKLIVLCEIEMIKVDPPVEMYNRLQILDNFERLVDDDKFSDVNFIIKGTNMICAHKNILANQSSVFATMFNKNTAKGTDVPQIVKINDISYEAVKEMLRFIYCGKVDKIKKFYKELLFAADKYKLDRLKVMCIKLLCENLSVGNAADVLSLSYVYHSKELQEAAIKFIVSNKHLMLNQAMEVADLDPGAAAKVLKALMLK